MKKFIIFLILLISMSTIFAEDNNNALGFSAMKTKQISVDFNIALPIYFTNYNEYDEFTYKTAIFANTPAQRSDVNAYYFDDSGQKIYAEVLSENGNSYAIFKVRPISRDEYIFYISGKVNSENTTILTNSTGRLEDINDELREYTKATRFIQSDSGEIRTISRFLKTSEDPLENLVYITNWVHSYVTYDLNFVDVVNDSKTVLSDRKGVCDEFSILEAAILRAQGYPVRYVVGYANTSQEWGSHAWLDVYIPGQGWIPVDPTYNEVGFVDSSHLILEKLKDPIESKDSVTSTNKVDVIFGEKNQSFNHTEIKNFENYGYNNIINMDLVSAKDAHSGSPFIFKLKLQNTTANPVCLLIVSQISSDFSQIYPTDKKTIYYLKAFESKIVDYYVILPELDNSYNYQYGFTTQFGDIMSSINIYDNRGTYQELFFSSEPIIYYKENQLFFEKSFYNYTNENKTIIFSFDYNGTEYSDTKTIPKETTATYTRNFEKLENVNFNYFLSGDYNSSKELQILPTIDPPKPIANQNPEKREIAEDEEKDINELFDRLDEQRINAKPKINYIMAVSISLFILFILYLLISKNLRKTELK